MVHQCDYMPMLNMRHQQAKQLFEETLMFLVTEQSFPLGKQYMIVGLNSKLNPVAQPQKQVLSVI